MSVTIGLLLVNYILTLKTSWTRFDSLKSWNYSNLWDCRQPYPINPFGTKGFQTYMRRSIKLCLLLTKGVRLETFFCLSWTSFKKNPTSHVLHVLLNRITQLSYMSQGGFLSMKLSVEFVLTINQQDFHMFYKDQMSSPLFGHTFSVPVFPLMSSFL